jgi:hypothetical protein
VRSGNVALSFAILVLGGATVDACAFIDRFPEVKPDPVDNASAGAGGSGGMATVPIGPEGVMCKPGTTEPCYGGPPGTASKGPCVGGLMLCNPDGMSYGPCVGQILPSFESCLTAADENCDDTGCVGATVEALSFGDSAAQTGMAVATFSNVVAIAGSGRGAIQFGGDQTMDLGDAQIDDTFLAKFDTSLSPLWSRRFRDSTGRGVAFVPNSGDVVLVGSARGNVDFGGGELPSADSAHHDAFVARLSPAGDHVSSQRYGDGPADQIANAVAALDDGDVVIAGEISGSLDCGNGTTLSSAGGSDVFLGRIDSNSKIVWCKRFGDAVDQKATTIAVAPGGDIVVAGSFAGSIDFGDGALSAPAGQIFLFVARFGPDGAIKWSKAAGTKGYARLTGVAVDPQSDILVAGYFTGELKFANQKKLQTDSNDEDIFLARLDLDGKPLWSVSFGDAADQQAMGVSVDTDGNALIAGSYKGNIDFGVNTPLAAGSGLDVFVAKLAPDSKSIWAKGFGGSGDQTGAAVATDRLGAAWITGSFAGDIDFGKGSIESAGATDAFLLKLTP